MSKVYIIAEIAQAHEGSLGIAHSYIDALSECGVSAVKFQTHIAAAESSDFEPFRVKFSYEDTTRYDYWKRMEFTIEQWHGLKQHCEEKGLEFISSPFSVEAVNLLKKLDVARFKIGSGEMSNYLMLHHIADSGKPIILSSGMSDYQEIDACVNFLKPFGNHLSLLQCTTAYPTTPEQWGLSEITRMKKKYPFPIGYSDHSADPTACIAAVALGAEILEFHAVFDKRMFGPDAKASLEINEIKQLVQSVRKLEESLETDSTKHDISQFETLKVMFGKSLAINKDLPKNHILTIHDLESKKPGNYGIPAKCYSDVVGKQLTRSLKQWDFINYIDIEA